MTNPAQYRVGAACLGLKPRRVVLREKDRCAVSAILHAINPRSTLAKSKSLSKKNEITDHILYAMLTNIVQMIGVALIIDKAEIDQKPQSTGDAEIKKSFDPFA